MHMCVMLNHPNTPWEVRPPQTSDQSLDDQMLHISAVHGPSILRPPIGPWKCGVILQVVLKLRFNTTQIHTLAHCSVTL